MYYYYFESFIGKLLLFGNEALEAINLPETKTRLEPEKDWIYSKERFQKVVFQLEAYFKGELKNFDLKLNIKGTKFQKRVWQELVKIPYGQTISYGELAKRIQNPKASRAVGMANNKNPIPIVIPCHRVIGKDGSLTGFGGGLWVKKKLLDLEKKNELTN